MFSRKKKEDKKEEDKGKAEKEVAAPPAAAAPPAVPMKGDLVIRPYRRATKDPTKVKERKAFEAKLKQIAAGYKSLKVTSRFPSLLIKKVVGGLFYGSHSWHRLFRASASCSRESQWRIQSYQNYFQRSRYQDSPGLYLFQWANFRSNTQSMKRTFCSALNASSLFASTTTSKILAVSTSSWSL
jgi:hypothetical protein